MNREDIIAMAREAGFDLEMWQLSLGSNVWGTHEELERFAALVAEAEREACAKVCDEQANSPALAALEKYRASFIADAIRARKDNS